MNCVFLGSVLGRSLRSGRKYQVSGGSLHIHSFAEDDIGVYKCSAVNQFGSDTASISLHKEGGFPTLCKKADCFKEQIMERTNFKIVPSFFSVSSGCILDY